MPATGVLDPSCLWMLKQVVQKCYNVCKRDWSLAVCLANNGPSCGTIITCNYLSIKSVEFYTVLNRPVGRIKRVSECSYHRS